LCHKNAPFENFNKAFPFPVVPSGNIETEETFGSYSHSSILSLTTFIKFLFEFAFLSTNKDYIIYKLGPSKGIDNNANFTI